MYRLYIKAKSETRFHPVDWAHGTLVRNLIYASLFTAEEKDELIKEDLAHPKNAHLVWEFRRATPNSNPSGW